MPTTAPMPTAVPSGKPTVKSPVRPDKIDAPARATDILQSRPTSFKLDSGSLPTRTDDADIAPTLHDKITSPVLDADVATTVTTSPSNGDLAPTLSNATTISTTTTTVEKPTHSDGRMTVAGASSASSTSGAAERLRDAATLSADKSAIRHGMRAVADLGDAGRVEIATHRDHAQLDVRLDAQQQSTAKTLLQHAPELANELRDARVTVNGSGTSSGHNGPRDGSRDDASERDAREDHTSHQESDPSLPLGTRRVRMVL